MKAFDTSSLERDMLPYSSEHPKESVVSAFLGRLFSCRKPENSHRCNVVAQPMSKGHLAGEILIRRAFLECTRCGAQFKYSDWTYKGIYPLFRKHVMPEAGFYSDYHPAVKEHNETASRSPS